MSIRLCVLGAALCALGVPGCAEQHIIDAPDTDLAVPSAVQLEVWSRETYRRDPCMVADYELKLRLDVCQWRAEPYNPQKYTFIERHAQRADWGSYVVRGFTDRSGRGWRYRVKVRKSGDVWYAIQLSHFLGVELEHPALESGGPPNPK